MKKNFLVIMIFLLLIVLMTFPLVFKVTTHLPGFSSTDEIYGTIWDSWRIKHSFLNKLNFKLTDFIAYPFGVNLFSSGYASYLYLVILYSLSILTTPVLTYNLQIIFNFFFSLSIVYALFFSLTRHRPVALFAALIFGFSPYQFVRSWQHISLTYNFLIPLSCLAIILLWENPNRKQSFLLMSAILLSFLLDYSTFYFAAITLGIFFIYSFFFILKKRFFEKRAISDQEGSYIKRVLIIIVFSVLFLFPLFFPAIKSFLLNFSRNPASAHNPYHRPFEDLFAQSARPLSYLLPAPTHPIFGKFTENFIGTSIYGTSLTEHVLYLGCLPLILAIVALRRWVRSRKAQGTRHKKQETEQFYLGFFIFLAFAAWLFSQPPWWNIFGFKLYMPSFFMYKILPMYRAYCRFGIVVMLAVAVLAGFGLKFILEKFKTKRSKITITMLACCVVLFEFWNYPPFKVIDVSQVPVVYSWLRGQPADVVVAEYPLDSDSSNEMYKFYQTKHEKKMINGTSQGTEANLIARRITKLSEKKTVGILKWLGVKFVIVHKSDYLGSDLIEDKQEILKITSNPGLKLIKTFPSEECPRKNIMCTRKIGEIDVYEVIAEPIKPDVN